MKKIVALVLSLVMVLGLATTAFAAVKPAYVAAVSDLTTPVLKQDAQNNDMTLAAYDYKLEQQVQEITINQTFAKQVIWVVDKTTNAPTLYGYYTIAASKDSATHAYVNGTEITYLVAYDSVSTWTKGLEVTKVPTVDEADAEKCGDIFVGDDKALYVDANGKFYVEGTGVKKGYVDGKYVKLGDATMFYNKVVGDLGTPAADAMTGEAVVVGHTYDCDYKTYGSANTVTRVFCEECDAEFDFVVGTATDAVKKFGAGNYGVAANLVAEDGIVFVSLVPAGTATAPVAPEAGDKVESAETFDAGIAMYVGMSVMAAAGSAVVLKKKD